MMKESNNDLPPEYISIRNIWLQAINDCRKAISQRAIQEPNEERSWREIGDRNIVYSVDALYYSLCDYGAARLRSDVDDYRETVYRKNVNSIWDRYTGRLNLEKLKEQYKDLDYFEREEKIAEIQNSMLSMGECWGGHAKEAILLYDYILQTMNKYNLLFEQQPLGFTNVEIEGVLENE